MALSPEETFHIEEYKSLREEIRTKLADRLQLNRWGILGMGGVYSYVLSHPDRLQLLWVPVGLSSIILALLISEHRIVAKAATYIRDHIESRFHVRSRAGAQSGWETCLVPKGPGSHIVLWSPTPIWLAIFVISCAVAFYAAPITSLNALVILNERDHRIVSVDTTGNDLALTLPDGLRIAVPLEWYPRLKSASDIQRRNHHVGPFTVLWPDLKEEIRIWGILNGRPGSKI